MQVRAGVAKITGWGPGRVYKAPVVVKYTPLPEDGRDD
jgi:hypothetical protein